MLELCLAPKQMPPTNILQITILTCKKFCAAIVIKLKSECTKRPASFLSIITVQTMRWMESQASFQVRTPEHTTTMDLIASMHGLPGAETYFDRLSASVSQNMQVLFHSIFM